MSDPRRPDLTEEPDMSELPQKEEHQPVDPTPAASPVQPASPRVEDRLSGDDTPGHVVGLAAHPSRLLAFAVDVLSIAAVLAVPALLGKLLGFGSAALFVIVVVLTVMYYQAVSVWLSGGQTIGKALFGLTVRCLDGAAPPRTPRGLAWFLGRHSVGYLVVDVLGLGALAALVTPRRRCLHDYAFQSQVVVADTSPQRLGSYWERVEAAQEETSRRYALVVSLWKWLTKLVMKPATVVLFLAGQHADSPLGRLRDRLADRVERFVDRLAGAAHPEASAPTPTSLFTKTRRRVSRFRNAAFDVLGAATELSTETRRLFKYAVNGLLVAATAFVALYGIFHRPDPSVADYQRQVRAACGRVHDLLATEHGEIFVSGQAGGFPIDPLDPIKVDKEALLRVLRGNLHSAEEEFALLNATPAPRSLAESKNRAVATQRVWADAFRNAIGAMEEAGIDRMTVAQGKALLGGTGAATASASARLNDAMTTLAGDDCRVTA
jgi:uncharacterized RDD family membrane protein YckC